MLSVRGKHHQQPCLSMYLTGQTGQAWLPKMAAVWHSRHYWPTDQLGRCSLDWPQWRPSLPGRHTLGWWTHSGTMCKHWDIVHRGMLKSFKSFIESLVHCLHLSTSCTRLSRSACVRVTAMTFAPPRARARAVALPIPEEPNVHIHKHFPPVSRTH